MYEADGVNQAEILTWTKCLDGSYIFLVSQTLSFLWIFMRVWISIGQTWLRSLKLEIWSKYFKYFLAFFVIDQASLCIDKEQLLHGITALQSYLLIMKQIEYKLEIK